MSGGDRILGVWFETDLHGPVSISLTEVQIMLSG